MACDKRFVDGIQFGFDDFYEYEFNNLLYQKNKFKFHYFDENGIIPDKECPLCSGCGRGFIDPKIPDPNTQTGKIDLSLAKLRFKERLELHIENEVELEINILRPDIQKKIKEKYFIPQIEEEFSTASSKD